MVLQGREIQFYDKLDAIAQRLGEGFVRIHQRYLVRAGAVDYICLLYTSTPVAYGI